jgi:hypothetical protein
MINNLLHYWDAGPVGPGSIIGSLSEKGKRAVYTENEHMFDIFGGFGYNDCEVR